MSAILSADDLNDFITPGVACIKPVESLSTSQQADTSSAPEVITEDALLASQPPPPVEISLTDCLACSGCVTSAEAVLISLQSHSEVLTVLDEAPALRIEGGVAVEPPHECSCGKSKNGGCNGERKASEPQSRIYVASVSPQTRASIAATFGVSETAASHMIEQLLSGEHGLRAGGKYGNGFQWVIDTNATRDACLVLGAEEVEQSLAKSNSAKPILTSACPGWICYAEKTHPYVLPHLSRLKSPQALMGTLVKTVLSRKLGVSPERIWHVAVMPCFDKKLEASREELTDSFWDGAASKRGVRDVDCVITSKELLMLANSRNIDFSKLPTSPVYTPVSFPDTTIERFLFPSRTRKNLANSTAGTSGGHLYYVLNHIASRNPGSTIESSRGRNADVVEYSVLSSSGDVIFKAARYYGFRNIQNLVRRLKPAKISKLPGARTGVARRPGAKSGPENSYVEVMACPGGCTNGGGQIKLDDAVVNIRISDTKAGPQEQKEWLAQVDEAYFSADESDGDDDAMDLDDQVLGISQQYIQGVLKHWSSTTGYDLEKLAYTTYRAVVSDVGKDVTDTQRVAALAGKIGGGW